MTYRPSRTAAERWAGQAAVYRQFSAEGRLLYIGCSSNPAMRHRTNFTEWRQQVAHITVTWFATREEAHAAEAHAIATEGPVHNVQHNPSPTRPSALPSICGPIVAKWLADNGMSEKTFALKIGKSAKYVRDLCRGAISPQGRIRGRIEIATGGYIMSSAWARGGDLTQWTYRRAEVENLFAEHRHLIGHLQSPRAEAEVS